MLIAQLRDEENQAWDEFAASHPDAGVYHLSGWRNAIESAYGHKTYYLTALEPSATAEEPPRRGSQVAEHHHIVGILPLVHIRHWLFGNSLVSIPYFDAGGVLAADVRAEQALIRRGVELAETLEADFVELRHHRNLATWEHGNTAEAAFRPKLGWRFSLDRSGSKVRMVLDLPATAELLMASFKAKLRSQIHKPLKAGLTVRRGGVELIDDFYDVFVENMRDLGSPVHSKRLLRNVLLRFPDSASLFVVYGEGKAMAGSLTIGFRELLSNPWASALRRYSKDAPNMLLYWTMLEFACDRGYRAFDFGRSTLDEGTYKFKEQWGATPRPLYWYRVEREGAINAGSHAPKARMKRAVDVWSRLPIPVTRFLGPRIRRYISL
jgi:serine/alanine adding enzyme